MQKVRSFLIISIIISFLIGGLSGLVSSLFVFNWSSNLGEQNFFKPGSLLKAALNNVGEKVEPIAAPSMKSDSEKIVEVVKESSPAVVSIVVIKKIVFTQSDLFQLNNLFNDVGFPKELKLNESNQNQDKSSGKQQIGSGSGFIVRSNGLILTNKHVVADSEAEYSVVTSDGKTYPAIVLAKDPFLDIALIKIEAKNLPVLSLGNSDKLEIGQTVVAIGNSLGEYQNSVTSGIISGTKRRVVAGSAFGSSEVLEAAIQTDAAINLGNSGGPLLNLQRQVVGINTAVNFGGQSVGFALPINSAKVIIDSVDKVGHIIRPWLGVRYIILTKELALLDNLSLDYGALILKDAQKSDPAVMPDSPAAKAGLLEGDIILEVNGQKVDEDDGLGSLINKYKVGQEITLKVWRKGEIKSIKVKLEEAISK